MSDQPTADRVAAILSEVLGVAVTAAEKPTRETLAQWDSIAQVNVIFGIEDEFGVQFTEQEMSELASLEAIVAAVEAKRGGQ